MVISHTVFNPDEIETLVIPVFTDIHDVIDVTNKFKNIKNIYLNDCNKNVAWMYSTIKNKHTYLIDRLEQLQSEYYRKDSYKYKFFVDMSEEIGPAPESYWELRPSDKEQMFIDIQKKVNEKKTISIYDNVEHIANFIFLSKTCKGNLFTRKISDKPSLKWNNKKKPLICDKEEITAIHNYLNSTNITIISDTWLNSLKGISSFGKTMVYIDLSRRKHIIGDIEFFKTCMNKLVEYGCNVTVKVDDKNNDLITNLFK